MLTLGFGDPDTGDVIAEYSVSIEEFFLLETVAAYTAGAAFFKYANAAFRGQIPSPFSGETPAVI